MRATEFIIKCEHVFEELIFRALWISAPAYVFLVGALAVLSYKSAEEFIQLIVNLRVFDEYHSILQVLAIVDLVRALNLVLMILFAGDTNFVSVMHSGKRPTFSLGYPHDLRMNRQDR